MKLANFLMITSLLGFVGSNALAQTYVIPCPPSSSVVISQNTDKSFPNPYQWVGPSLSIFGESGTAPQNGNKVLGNAVDAFIIDYGVWTDFLCAYPSNSTTPGRGPLPDGQGYLLYRAGYSQEECKVVGAGFVCTLDY